MTKYLNSYYACSDTCLGFINYFYNIFESQNLEKLYIIKDYVESDFLSKFAQYIVNKKYFPEYILCPFNSNRLYGIIIKELKIAVIDEILYKNNHHLIVENIINFNDFYDNSKIIKNKKDIIELKTRKLEYNNLAYKFLKASNELCENINELTNKYINHEKLYYSIERLLNKHVNEKHLQPHSKNNNIDEYKFINSIFLPEYIKSEIFENEAKQIFYISNENLLGFYYLKAISENFKNLCKVICPDALNPENLRAVYLKDFKILFVVNNKTNQIYDEKYHFINMERFVSANLKKENKQKLNFIKKCYKSVLNESLKYFNEIENINKNIENIYIPALNTNAQNNYTEEIINKILP